MSAGGKTAVIAADRLDALLDVFSAQAPVYMPYRVDDRKGGVSWSYRLRSPGDRLEYPGYRPQQPLKTFLFAGRSRVAEYPGDAAVEDLVSSTPVFVVGAAGCDVVSLRSLDVVFLQEEFTDVFYQARREALFIVSMDCTEPRETCFCTLAGDQPWAEDGYDLNLSPLDGQYIVEAGSEKGEQIIDGNPGLFTAVTPEMLDEREKRRSIVRDEVVRMNIEWELAKPRKELLEAQRMHDTWFDEVSTCVECAACLFSCPTCHCFLLYDQKGSGGKFERVREWDACVYSGFSRMAGGSNPRLGLLERFRHRYEHKLEYYPKNFGFEACTGCGRCVEGCMGSIDMRRVLKRLESATQKPGVSS